MNNTLKVYDNYEISGCAKSSEYPYEVEQVNDPEAQFWTLFGHLHGEGVEAIGDFATCEHAEEVYSRITGLRYTGANEADRLRVMHAGPMLLDALTYFFNIMHDYGSSVRKGYVQQAMQQARAAIEAATGRAA
jgi:hypothetical protein